MSAEEKIIKKIIEVCDFEYEGMQSDDSEVLCAIMGKLIDDGWSLGLDCNTSAIRIVNGWEQVDSKLPFDDGGLIKIFMSIYDD